MNYNFLQSAICAWIMDSLLALLVCWLIHKQFKLGHSYRDQAKMTIGKLISIGSGGIAIGIDESIFINKSFQN